MLGHISANYRGRPGEPWLLVSMSPPAANIDSKDRDSAGDDAAEHLAHHGDSVERCRAQRHSQCLLTASLQIPARHQPAHVDVVVSGVLYLHDSPAAALDLSLDLTGLKGPEVPGRGRLP